MSVLNQSGEEQVNRLHILQSTKPDVADRQQLPQSRAIACITSSLNTWGEDSTWVIRTGVKKFFRWFLPSDWGYCSTLHFSLPSCPLHLILMERYRKQKCTCNSRIAGIRGWRYLLTIRWNISFLVPCTVPLKMLICILQ